MAAWSRERAAEYSCEFGAASGPTVEQHQHGGFHRFGVFSPATDDCATCTMLVVENGSEVILHELSHFQRLADKLTFGNINISFAPEDIPLGSCQSFLAIEEPYSISRGFSPAADFCWRVLLF